MSWRPRKIYNVLNDVVNRYDSTGGRQMKKKIIIATIVLGVIGVVATGTARLLELKERGIIETPPAEE